MRGDAAAPLLYDRWLGAQDGSQPLASGDLAELEITARLRASRMGVAARVIEPAAHRHGLPAVIGAILHVDAPAGQQPGPVARGTPGLAAAPRPRRADAGELRRPAKAARAAGRGRSPGDRQAAGAGPPAALDPHASGSRPGPAAACRSATSGAASRASPASCSASTAGMADMPASPRRGCRQRAGGCRRRCPLRVDSPVLGSSGAEPDQPGSPPHRRRSAPS